MKQNIRILRFGAFLTITDEISLPFAGPEIAFSPQGFQAVLKKPTNHVIIKSPGSKSLSEFERGH